MGEKDKLVIRERFKMQYRGVECLNCKHPLDISDRFCPNCSQVNSTKKMALRDFVDEFLNSLINYDSKLLVTLRTLLIRPGTITKDYIKGKRVSYTNPFRFLLSLAFIYFILFAYNSNLSDFDRYGENLNGNFKKTGPFSFSLNIDSDDILRDSVETQKVTEEVLKQLDSLGEKGVPGLSTLKGLDSLKGNFSLKNLDSLQRVEARKEAQKDSLILSNPKHYFQQLEDSTGFSGFTQKMEFFGTMIPHDTIRTFQMASEKYGVKNSLQNQMAFNSANSTLKVISRPGSFLNDTMAKFPFVVFFFLPVFAVFIKLTYIRKNYTYTDHLIFSFHNQSLLFILLIISLLVDTIFGTASAGLFMLIFAIYLYKAMRRFYGQGRFKTIVKYIFLNSVFAFLAFLTVILLFTGSVFTY